MELVWGMTLWGLWSAWLLCQHLRAPILITRGCAALLVAELLALAVHSYGCDAQGCGTAALAARSAATYDLPALAALFVALGTGHALRVARRGTRSDRA